MSGPIADLAGRRLLVVSRRDSRHPQAGELERYVYEIARRWVAQDIEVTWVTGPEPGMVAEELLDGIRLLRLAAAPHRQPRLAVATLRRAGPADVVIDATGELASILPFITGRRTPVVRLVHPRPPLAGDGRDPTWPGLVRSLAGPVAAWTRSAPVVVTPSPTARLELRRNAGLRGPVFVVPAGVPEPDRSTPRAAEPTIVVDAQPLPGQRLGLLLPTLARIAGQTPRLHVRILGDGPELLRLRRLIRQWGLAASVALPGRVSDVERDAWLCQAWLTVSTATVDRDGGALLRATAYGVPCVALDEAGARDFILAGRTGQVVTSPDELGPALLRWLAWQADPDRSRQIALWCRAWADRFSWDRSARLFAGAVGHALGAARVADGGTAQRRYARPDIATLVRLPRGVPVPTGALRVTDEVVETDGAVSALLSGCDEFDALGVLNRLGVEATSIRLASHNDLMAGPAPLPAVLTRMSWTEPDEVVDAQPRRAPATQKG